MEMNLPNKLTIFRIILIPVFIFLLAVNVNLGDVVVFNQIISMNQIWATIIFIVASLTDFLDGQIARRDHLVTNFGKFADPLADKMLVMTAFVFLAAMGKAPAWIVAIILCRELAITGLRTLLVENGQKVLAAQMPGKIKTTTQMLAIILLLLNNILFESIGIPMATIMLYIALIFTIYSGVDYFVQNKSVFNDTNKK
ncbi:CDP-diacylglycerol--glycerol-3-phosphate 3-phosphatidyltransferase [Companilactobacillus sp. RD055328]|nr:CDP-diacylglycerol--glycerol-3-phosphate 3-phosphatidyltransferase [Companilactobacillus sp. RD055328]